MSRDFRMLCSLLIKDKLQQLILKKRSLLGVVVRGLLQVFQSYPLTLFSPVSIKTSTHRPIFCNLCSYILIVCILVLIINLLKYSSCGVIQQQINQQVHCIYIMPCIRHLYATPQAETLSVFSIRDRNILTFHNAL